MSRLWDTPEYWVRYEADEALIEMPDAEPATLADSLERNSANYDDPAMAVLIVAELRRRAAAGIRFWPGPHPVDPSPANETAGDHATRAEPDIADLSDDEIPW